MPGRTRSSGRSTPNPKKQKVKESKATTQAIARSTQTIFDALDLNSDGTVSSTFLIDFLARQGLQNNDPRLAYFFECLRKLGAADSNVDLTIDQFNTATSECGTLMHNAVTGKLRVPDFQSLAEQVKRVFATVEPNVSGANADYIPQLAAVNPDQFGISITSVDGQQYNIGDTDVQFCIQSCSKPISYLIGLREFGIQYVHNSVGTEPSGRRFNEMCLKDCPSESNPGRQIPHNPMINAGAIMACSMVHPDEKSRQRRLERVMDVWRDLSGPISSPSHPISYDNDTYRSESSTADRNWCLGYMMKEKKAFPACFTNLSDTLELYFQICSILSTNSAMSIMAATLANGGLNPLTGKRVFSPMQVRCALPLMLSSGMYDYSGQWFYDIGVPAKSGVGGCVFMVIPNLCGIAVWSPRLDDIGNSARGVHVAQELVKVFSFHNFEVFSGLSQTKIDPRKRKNEAKHEALGACLFAASVGDMTALASHREADVNIYAADYDKRTALHLAASEGHVDAVRFLIENCPADTKDAILSAADRWGGTPLDDAIAGEHEEIINMLSIARAQNGTAPDHSEVNENDNVSDDAGMVIFAAAEDQLDSLIAFYAQGHDIFGCDYDHRTALHLAASNGHLRIVQYLIAKARSNGCLARALSACDRWGGTPHADAVREGHQACADALSAPN